MSPILSVSSTTSLAERSIGRYLLGTRSLEANPMGINSESDTTASLQIGPTTLGMVRIYLEGDGIDLPLDFDPEEAEDIAEELRAAAMAARKMSKKKG
jgi:hypothetical protein